MEGSITQDNFAEICLVKPSSRKVDCLSSIDLSFENSDNDDENLTGDASIMPLKGCIVFVDVRAENENRSKAISRELERLGAMIAEKITHSVSHVVYKDGRNNTLKQLKKFPHIHLVSVLWVDSCKNTSARMCESLFPVNVHGSYDSPLPMARTKRVKSLQPKTFEEDLNNSAKKEEKKKRRFKKFQVFKNKDPETPKDQILCLDSQEYIKSSDLYKMVATPRAIPDTPWILNYINGTQDDTSSQIDSSAQKSNCINDKEITSPDHLSQDFLCRLNFDDAVDENNISLISLGNSPTMNMKDGKSTKKVAFDTEISRSVSPKPTLKKSTSGEKGWLIRQSSISTKENVNPELTDGGVFTHLTSIAMETFSTNTRAEERDTSGALVVGNPKIPKKKKKLMSTKSSCFPQEKLITPTTKTNSSKHGNLLKPKSHGVKCVSNHIGCGYTAFDAIHAVVNSKKICKETVKTTIKFKEPLQSFDENKDSDHSLGDEMRGNPPEKHDVINEDIDSTIALHAERQKQFSKREDCSSVAIGEKENISATLNRESINNKASQRRRSTRRSSGIDFKANRSFRKVLSQKGGGNITMKDRSDKENLIPGEKYDKSVSHNTSVNKSTLGNVARTISEVGVVKIVRSSSVVIPREDDSGISESEEINVGDHLSLGENSSLNERSSLSHRKDSKCKPKRKLRDSMTASNGSKMKASLVTTSLHYGEQEYIRAMVKQLGGFTLRKNISSDTTHVVAGGPRRTLNILNGIIRGCWILEPKWVADSVEEGKWLCENNYEMYGEFPIARVCRINRIRNNTYSHMNLFARLPPLYLAEVTCPSHEEMMKLIIACGGQLTTSIRKAGVGIGLINCRRKDLNIVTEKWILDSISNGRIMPTKSYEIRLKREREGSPDY